ncbi:MAG: tetratricopeptide repeat protein [Acidobacteria bacterium]|nr:tetratricopeptide repeat protein [Acidobacteriota bacterium]
MADRIVELQRELAANPTSRQFYQLGELLRRDGRAGEAASVLTAGLVHHPRYVAAWVALGRARIETGEVELAADVLRKALDLDVSNPVSWRLLGEARLMQGQRLAALDAMQHALDLVPGDDLLQASVDALASETAPPVGPPRALVEPPAAAPLAAVAAPLPVLEAEMPPTAPAQPEPVPDAFAVESYAIAEVPPEPVAEPVVAVQALPAGAPAWPEPAAEPVAVAPPEPFVVETPLGPPSADPFEFTDHGVSLAAGLDDVFGFGPPLAEPAPAPGPAEPFAVEQAAELPALVPAEVAPPETVGEAFEPAAVVAAPAEAPEPEAIVEPPFAGEAVTPAVVTELPVEPPDAAPAPWHQPVAVEVPEAHPEAAAAQPPATMTLARLYIQQQQLPKAVEVLERLKRADPDNQEAADLLELVRDMLEPLDEPLPPLSVRERKIAALQRFLACLTLGRDRAQA